MSNTHTPAEKAWAVAKFQEWADEGKDSMGKTIEWAEIYSQRESHGIACKGVFRIMERGTGHGGMNRKLGTVRADTSAEAMSVWGAK